jgi:hypothetical protein
LNVVKGYIIIGLEVLTVAIMKSAVVLDMTPFSGIKSQTSRRNVLPSSRSKSKSNRRTVLMQQTEFQSTRGLCGMVPTEDNTLIVTLG